MRAAGPFFCGVLWSRNSRLLKALSQDNEVSLDVIILGEKRDLVMPGRPGSYQACC